MRLPIELLDLYLRLKYYKPSFANSIFFMIRRIVCLMLVPALLANQAVLCCAHTHGGSESSDHSARAHVHQSGHSHDSCHRHDGESSEHHHDSKLPENSTPATCLEMGDPAGHDHDAIYIGEQVDLHLPTSRVSVEESTVAAQWLVIENPPVIQLKHRCQQTRAGPLGLHSVEQCAIFLQTCRLLI